MRRITKARINFVSLVPRGANRLPVIYKEDGAVDLDALVKIDTDFDDKGEVLAVVYAPEFRDSQGDIASAEVIKEAMYDAARRGEGIDIRHDGKTLEKGKAFVAERFIIQKGDGRFADMRDYDGKQVDVAGAWATVIKIDDAELRKLYREGKWSGVSMGGVAEVKAEKSNQNEPSDESAIIRFLKALMGITQPAPDNGDLDMKPEELTAALAANNKTLAETIAKCLKPETSATGQPAPGDDDDTKAPTFKGDPLKIEDVRKHGEAVAAFEARKSVDWTKPDAVAAHLKKLEDAKAGAGGKTETAEETLKKDYEKKLADLRGRSAQPLGGAAGGGASGGGASGGGTDAGTGAGQDISKEEQDQVTASIAAATAINKERGYAAKTA